MSSVIAKRKARVVIAGRPNVGKSTLFNCLAKGGKKALVDATPGVTRDSKILPAEIDGLSFDLVDTAGLELFSDESMARRLNALAEQAIETADVILFLVDGTAGVTPLDEDLAAKIRTYGKPIIPIVNKMDVKKAESTLMEIYSLGLEGAVGISATHSKGFGDLSDALTPFLEKEYAAETEDEGEGKPLQMAIVGRPNAGKSTLVNALLKSERMLTGPEAGLTRESIGTLWKWEDNLIELVDTPGMRKQAKVVENLEKMSVGSALDSINRSEAVVLVLDATCPLEKQDLLLAAKSVEEGKPLVIALNKWDLVEDREDCLEEMKHKLMHSFSQVKGVPFVPMSALKGKSVEKIIPEVLRLNALWKTRISTGKLNRFLDGMQIENPPPMRSGRRLKLKYISQISSAPPTFALWCNMPKKVPDSYLRYLTNGMREAFGLEGIVIRILPKSSENPYGDKK